MAGGGAITGVGIEGAIEAIRSDADDLTVIVHGTVTGDIKAFGDGDLLVQVWEHGTVAGGIFGCGRGMHTVEFVETARILGTVRNPKSGTTIRANAALETTADGLVVGVEPVPRHRVYEALPSVLPALNALPAHGDRFVSAAPPRGVWARVDAGGGGRRPASSTAGSLHDYRR